LNIKGNGLNSVLLFGSSNGKLRQGQSQGNFYFDATSAGLSAFVLELENDIKTSLSLPSTSPAEGALYSYNNGELYLKAAAMRDYRDSGISISGLKNDFSRRLKYHGVCGTEGCVGITFLNRVQKDSIIWSTYYDGRLKETYSPSENIYLTPGTWTAAQDSVYLNDSFIRLTSSYYIIKLDKTGELTQLLNEDVKVLSPKPAVIKQTVLAGKTGIFVFGAFQDSIMIDSQKYKDSGYNYFLIKYGEDLQLTWKKVVGTGENVRPRFKLDSSDNVVILGNTSRKGISVGNQPVPLPGDTLTYIYKINKDGKDVSTWFYPSNPYTEFYPDPKGNIYLALIQRSIWSDQSFDGHGVYIYKIDPTGIIMPHNIRLPFNVKGNDYNIQDILFGEDAIVVVQPLNYGKTVLDNGDTLNIQASPSQNSQSWLVEKFNAWEFTSIKTGENKDVNMGVYYAKEYLNINGRADRIDLFNLAGKKIYSSQLESGDNQRLFIPLQKGIYLYKTTSKLGTSAGKFIVK
jgi:hypothetical protein